MLGSAAKMRHYDHKAHVEKSRGRRVFMRKLGRFLNRPFSVAVLSGIFVLVVSTKLQDRYWLAQQQFLAKQATINKRLEATSSTEEDMVRAVGRFLTAKAVIVGAHENRLSKREVDAAVDEHNRLREDWDQTSELLKLKMRSDFPTPAVYQKWLMLDAELTVLDEEVNKLSTFEASDPSAKHITERDRCRALISEAESMLASLTLEMNKFAATLGTA